MSQKLRSENFKPRICADPSSPTSDSNEKEANDQLLQTIGAHCKIVTFRKMELSKLSLENGWEMDDSWQIASSDKEITIDDLATATFVKDLKRALGMVGCTAQCLDYFGVSDDDTHDFIADGMCLESSKEHANPTTDISGLVVEIDNKTINSESTHSGTKHSGIYESFANIEGPANCARSSLFTKCLQPKK